MEKSMRSHRGYDSGVKVYWNTSTLNAKWRLVRTREHSERCWCLYVCGWTGAGSKNLMVGNEPGPAQDTMG